MDWYYASNGQQKGPVSQEELIAFFEKGQVKSTDLVWNESMSDWMAYRSVSDLNSPKVSTEPGGGSETPPPMEQAPSPATTPAPATVAAEPPTAANERISSYLWQSIVLLICCCPPTAIVALVYSVKVEPALQTGDIASAKEASSKARMWCWITFGLGLVFGILVFGFVMVGAVAEMGGL